MSALQDKVVIITGASGGIGAGIAEAVALQGGRVVLAARRLSALEAVQAKLQATDGISPSSVAIHVTDVTKRSDWTSLIEFASTTFDKRPIDVLVNNAGVMHFELMKNVNQDEWDRTIDINCKGTLNGIAAVLPSFLNKKSGHIVNITSDAGRKVFPGLGVYSASKMFLEAVSQSLRLENVGSGLKVTCVQPGNVKTELVANANATAGVDTEAMELYGQPSTCKVLSPSDIGNAVVYALSQPPHVAVNEILVEPRDEPI